MGESKSSASPSGKLEANVRSPSTKWDESISTSVAANSSSSSFEFKAVKAAAIFECLAKAFALDYMTKKFARDDSGWRSLGDVAQDMRVSTSIVYSKKRNQLSPPVRELVERGFIEKRFFQRERGRGGEVMRLRIAYENDMIKDYIDRKIMGSPQRKTTDTMLVAQRTGSEFERKTEEKLGKLRIAVLPFVNISPDPKDEYFADGMTEELISTMSKISDLKVIARTSVMSYKDEKKKISEIAKELRVGTVLEGSVRKAGDELRISVQLIDVENDEHLWSQNYDRKFENVFSLQKEIALKVADSLQVTILAKESKELGKKPTQNMEAYILYLKSRSYRRSHRGTLDSLKKRIDYCEQAIQKDPNYAQAYAEIATCYSIIGNYETLPSNEVFPKAEKFAEKAIQLNPFIPESHLALGQVLLWDKWDFQGAEIEVRRALELSPNLVDGHLDLAFLLGCNRRFDEAILQCNRALELDPLSAFTCTWAGSTLFLSRRYDQAIEVMRNAIELDPNFSAWTHDNLGIAYVKMGMVEKGIAEIKISIEISGGIDAQQKNDLAYAYARAGKMDEVKNILADLLRMREQGYRSELAIGGVYLSLGEKDKAMEWLERAYELHAGYLVWINSDPTFEDIRSDPRFQTLLRKIGFPDAE